MAYDFPASPTTGTQYIAPNILYVYEGTAWSTRGSDISPNPFADAFKYRTIYTRGYTSAGYRNGTPWRNVNKTIHSTDMTSNLGDLLDTAASYIDGGFSDYTHFVYGMSGSVGGTSTNTLAVNMSNDTGRSNDAIWNTKTSRADCVVLMNSNLSIAYITLGGSTATDKHSYITEVMFSAGSAPSNPVGGGGTGGAGTAMFGEFSGWFNYNGSSAALTWSTETWASGGWTTAGGTDGQPKGLSSKHGYGYSSIGSYAATATYYKYSDVTGGSSVLSISRPESCGEENCQIGQNWGYTIGAYNGTQNNNSTKTSYLTDTCIAMGSDTQPKGHDGMSSAACGTASAQMLGGV